MIILVILTIISGLLAFYSINEKIYRRKKLNKSINNVIRLTDSILNIDEEIDILKRKIYILNKHTKRLHEEFVEMENYLAYKINQGKDIYLKIEYLCLYRGYSMPNNINQDFLDMCRNTNEQECG